MNYYPKSSQVLLLIMYSKYNKSTKQKYIVSLLLYQVNSIGLKNRLNNIVVNFLSTVHTISISARDTFTKWRNKVGLLQASRYVLYLFYCYVNGRFSKIPSLKFICDCLCETCP